MAAVPPCTQLGHRLLVPWLPALHPPLSSHHTLLRYLSQSLPGPCAPALCCRAVLGRPTPSPRLTPGLRAAGNAEPQATHRPLGSRVGAETDRGGLPGPVPSRGVYHTPYTHTHAVHTHITQHNHTHTCAHVHLTHTPCHIPQPHTRARTPMCHNDTHVYASPTLAQRP